MHIGILQTGHTADGIRETRGDFDAMFARLLDGHGFTFSAYDVEHMVFPASVREADGWLITGSRHGAYEEHAFIPPLEAFIRDVVAADVPIVGICFGHQIIAQALGGKVEKFPAGWSIGRTEYATTGGETLTLNAWHQDQVIVPPEGTTTLASNDFCTHAILSYGRRAFTVQPHPEFDNELMADYVTFRRGTGTYPDALMDAAAAATGLPIDDHKLAGVIAGYFKTREANV